MSGRRGSGAGPAHSLIRALEAPGLKTQPLLTCACLLWQHLPRSIFLLHPPSLLRERSSIFPPPPTIPFNHLCFPSPALNLFCPFMCGFKRKDGISN